MLSKGEIQTRQIAADLWKRYKLNLGKKAIVFGLEGDLGAGKTVFSKGLAEAMGVKTDVVSPTFVLHISHLIPGTQSKLEHIDAWRMEKGSELEELDWEKMLEDKPVGLIEWADRVEEVIKAKKGEALVVWVKMGYGEDEDERTIEIEEF